MCAPDFQKPTAPRISLSGARAAYVGPGLDLAPHRNAAATVAIGLEAPFELAYPGDTAREATITRIALIAGGTLHHLRANGDMAFVYLDALSDDDTHLRCLDLQGTFAQMAGPGKAGWDVDSLCSALGVPARSPRDARIAAAIRRIDARPQDFARVDDAAALAGLSASRFQALFRQELGMPFRRYRLWRRMALVMHALAAGASLTTAAHEAEFASSAHLSTTFKSMFGLAPSRLLALDVELVLAA